MAEGFVKALTFILFIFIGILLKRKFTSKDEVTGLKKIILLLALPATIFIALLKIKVEHHLFLLPFLALGLNVLLYIITPSLLLILGITDKPTVNTARLLIPSLAPGLSCFPFILEFLGEDYLAKAAMADLGNKFFVLFVLYLLAIKWHYKNQAIAKQPMGIKLKKLGKTMLFEPVNLFIIIALVLVFFKVNFAGLPLILQDILNRLSLIMTPLVLIFIGLSVKIEKKQFAQIFSILMLRASLTIFTIALLVSIFKVDVETDVLLYLAFGLSACSFWPFAHISIVASKEIDVLESKKTFNVDFSLAILALSLPISVILVLGILTANNTFVNIDNMLLLALFLMLLGIIMPFYSWSKKGARIKEKFKEAEEL